jgi:hypothetical protein
VAPALEARGQVASTAGRPLTVGVASWRWSGHRRAGPAAAFGSGVARMARAPRLPGAPVDPGGTTNASSGNQSSSPRRQNSWQSRDGLAPEAGIGRRSGQGTAKPSRSAACRQLARNARLVGTMATPSTSTAFADRDALGSLVLTAADVLTGTPAPLSVSSRRPVRTRAPTSTTAAATHSSLRSPADPDDGRGRFTGPGRWRPGGNGR